MRSNKYFFLAFTIGLAASIAFAPASISAAKRRSGGGGGGGGVYLQTPNPQTPVEHNNRGVELGQKGLWPDAIREHETALAMDPNSSTWRTNLSAAHLEYGKWLNAHGKKDLSCAEFRRAMIIDPANAAADAELDNVLASLKRNPNDYNYRRQLADDADVSGQYDTAIVEWRKCVKMRDDALSQAYLGRVLLKAGKQVDGYKALKAAVGRNDWTPEQRLELATTHRQLGDILKEFAMKAKDAGKGTKGMQRLANAGVEYRRAVTINPADGQAIEGLITVAQNAVSIKNSFDNHLLLAGAYLLAGKFANAQQEYTECYKKGPNRGELTQARIAFHQAVARSPLASDVQVADSVDKVKKLIDDSPNDAQLWYILGRLREHQSDFEKAKKCYDKAITLNKLIDPDLPQAMVRIGASAPETIASTGPAKTPEQSKEALQKVMKEKERTEVETMIENGQLDDALTRAQADFSKDPKDGSMAGLIGRAYEKKGDPSSAKSWYRIGMGLGDQTSARFFEQVDADKVLAKMKEAGEFMDAKNYIEAKSVFQDIVVMAPKRADAHRKLGDCLKELGDIEGSKKEYADADRIDRGEAPLPPTKVSDSDKPDSAPAAEDKKGKKVAEKKPEAAPEEQGLKAEGLQMQSVKKKK